MTISTIILITFFALINIAIFGGIGLAYLFDFSE